MAACIDSFSGYHHGKVDGVVEIMRPLSFCTTGMFLTQAAKHCTPSMEKDDATLGLGRDCLGLKKPHRDCAKMQVLHKHTKVLLLHKAILYKVGKVGHGGNVVFLSLFPCGKEKTVGGFQGSSVLSILQRMLMWLLIQTVNSVQSFHLNVAQPVSPKMHK